MKRTDILEPKCLWERPVAEPKRIKDCSGNRHFVVECTDGHYRRVVNNRVCNSMIYCPRYKEWRNVVCDDTGKVILIHIICG